VRYLLTLLLLSGCSLTKEEIEYSRKRAAAACRTDWGESGFQWRVVANGTDTWVTYSCQLQVNGRWVPASSVKVTPDA
jgi:hypothetical protein